MNTTAAALKANVTIATIRTWCRIGAVAAVKTAGRWVIDTTSLAHRITIGQMRTRKAHTMALDFTATYTVTYAGDRTPTIVTPKIRTRDRDGVTYTTIRNLAPLLADKINAIAAEGSRLHALTVLERTVITIRSEPDMPTERDNLQSIAYRDFGRLATNHQNTQHVTVDDVLDLAEQIRTQLQH